MSRLIAAILLLAISIGGSVFLYFRTLTITDELLAALERDRQLTAVSGASVERAEELEKTWKKKESFLTAALNNGSLESIEIDIKSMPAFASQQLDDEYLDALDDCISRLRHIKEAEAPTPGNIL